MTITARHALVTGSSRGIGRGIALKLAEEGVHVAVNYLSNAAAAQATLQEVRARGSDGFVVQADVCQPSQIERMLARVREEFGGLDIFVSNARGEVGTFYEPAMSIGLDKWEAAMNSQARAFLVAVREAQPIMREGGRIVAITYAPGGVYGSWQSWVGMGAAKSALEVLVRYFAVALAPRGITVNAVSPGWTEERAQHAPRARAADDPRPPPQRLDAHAPAGDPRRCRERGGAVLLEGSRLDHRPAHSGRRRDGPHGPRAPAGHPAAGAAAGVTRWRRPRAGETTGRDRGGPGRG